MNIQNLPVIEEPRLYLWEIIDFFKNRQDIPHLDQNLQNCDKISITFKKQKNDHYDDTITMPHSNDPIMCPVKASAFIVRKVKALPGITEDTTIDTFIDHTSYKFTRFTAASLILLFQATVTVMGYASLGFHACEIRTPSNRSPSATSMYLNGIPAYTIILVGRWSSDAVLL